MKKISFMILMTILVFVSCDKEDEIRYEYIISNQTEKDINTIFVYSFEHKNGSTNKDSENNIPVIKAGHTSSVLKVKYPYIVIYASNDSSIYTTTLTRYPAGDEFYELLLDQVNVIELE